ncbi:MAG: hydroxymethylpyrimidine/phosphomethylpyrimidine kinase, partial [Candidatus Aminicenantes bacterium]|nr:hydroxymethylpyrimidine/phosphomethylpyrimidine kinase [Candidatus Aminicenantes bacterium]
GGAGVLLDLHVIEGLGFRGAAVVTAVTAQTAVGVRSCLALPPALVKRQFEALAEDLNIAGIKVGMLGSGANLRVVAGLLGRSRPVPRVVDPVFRATSGAWLLGRRAAGSFLASISGRATLLTPNVAEASLLTGRTLTTVGQMKAAALGIFEGYGIPCLIKGGRFRGRLVDVLYDGREHALFVHARSRRDVHGTGCFLSSAILGFLARGRTLHEACHLGIELTAEARRRALRVGRGRPVFIFPL